MARRAPSTLAEAVRRAIVRAVIVTAALAVGYGVTSLVTVTRPPSGDVMAERPTAEGSPSAAMAEAERRGLVCWTSAAPDRYADAVPTHVVWHRADGRAVVSARLVGPALDTLFGDGDLAGRPIAFCHR